MLRVCIWPLVARKRQEKGFSGPQNKVLRICWPPEAKMTPSQKTQKIPILNIIFQYLLPRGHFLPLGGQKNVENLIPWTGKLFILPLWPPGAKNYPPSENTNKLKRLFCILSKKVILGLWRSENGERKDFWVPRIMFFCVFWPPKGRKQPLGIKY